jgi:hypothetical protein
MDAVDVQNFHKLQDAYNAYLNESIIDQLGALPLLALLENVIAKYPVDSICHLIRFQMLGNGSFAVLSPDEPCSEIIDSLIGVIEYLQSIGVGTLFSLVVTVANP